MSSGLEHLAQKIGRIPNLKIDVPNNKDSERALFYLFRGHL